MKIRIRNVFGIFCLLMLPVAGLQAQTWKYPRVESGNTIVSRDAMGGIKEIALLTPAQETFLMNQSTQPMYNELSENNKVPKRLRVAQTDAFMGPDGTIYMEADWATAYGMCKLYSESDAGAGTWRLPTQRELTLIWIFKSKLNAGTALTGEYWTGTNSTTTSAWALDFATGHVFGFKKDMTKLVRCVRSIDL